MDRDSQGAGSGRAPGGPGKKLVGIWELPKPWDQMTEDEEKALAQEIADRVAEQAEKDRPQSGSSDQNPVRPKPR